MISIIPIERKWFANRSIWPIDITTLNQRGPSGPLWLMAKKRYQILSRSPKLDSHLHMHFSVKPNTPLFFSLLFFVKSYSSDRVTISVFPSTVPSWLGLLNALTVFLQRGKTIPPNKYPGYDTKQSDIEAPVLGLRGIWSTPSLPLLPGPL